MATTEYPWWSRAQRGSQAVSVSLPPIEPDAMVLFLNSYAYSYLVPFMPVTARAVGVNSNLVRPGSPGKLQGEIARAIRDHKGPLWGMEYPEAFPGIADASLATYALRREGDCTLLDTNIEDKRFCQNLSATPAMVGSLSSRQGELIHFLEPRLVHSYRNEVGSGLPARRTPP